MAVITLDHERLGNTLTLWFGDPTDEGSAEETGGEVLLMKNVQGAVRPGLKPPGYPTAPRQRG